MLWLILSYLVMVFVIPLALSLVIGYRALPRGRACPECTGDTISLRIVFLTWLQQRRGSLCRLERRWCLDCGWNGFARVEVRHAQPLLDPVAPDARPGYSETLDVRTITIDGTPWRVMLQCWNQTRQCYGRLMFVEPTGRLWPDPCEAFSGSSRFEVIGQALSVNDTLLRSRLRRILSEA